MPKSAMKIVVVVIAALVIVAGIAFYFFQPAPVLPKAVTINTTNQPTMGNPKAKVHFVAFEDLKCGNCMRYNVNLYPTIKKRYIKTGRAKYTVMNVAFIPGSMTAANAARCLYAQNPDFFFPFVAYLYHHQGAENQNWATIPVLLAYANKIKGVNANKLEQCLLKSPYNAIINNNLKEAMKIMGGEAMTPSLYVNGMLVKPLTLKRVETLVKAAEKS